MTTLVCHSSIFKHSDYYHTSQWKRTYRKRLQPEIFQREVDGVLH
jgi:hypothetical protein